LSLTLYSPSGAVPRQLELRRATRRLQQQGFDVTLDEAALARHQRFAGDDDTRLQAIYRVAHQCPDVALATRGGYGISRLLDRLDWPLLARSVEQGTHWVGHSDISALQLGLLAHTGASSWAGPLALSHWGGVQTDEVTVDAFGEAMRGELEGIGFRTDAGHDGLACRGVLWGGNLTLLCGLIGTPHLPRIQGGILFLEDVNEHPYRVERQLLQLIQAGILERQKAVLLGGFTGWVKAPNDRGYGLKAALEAVRARVKTPILTGLPYGHVPMLVCLPMGRRVQLLVEGRDAYVGW
jgi:muramoyltetrapeptide carboxypeptidase